MVTTADPVDDRGGLAVRQREEDDFCLLRQQFCIGLSEPEGFGAGMMPELRKYLRNGLSGALTRGNRGEFDVRMPEEQPHQFFTGVTGPADDGDFLFHLRCPWSVVNGRWFSSNHRVLRLTTENRLPSEQKPRRLSPAGFGDFNAAIFAG